jgi:hypothetical protein
MTLGNEFGRIWNEEVVGKFTVLTIIFWRNQVKPQGTSIRIGGIRAQIRTRNLRNTTEKRYRLRNLLAGMCS